MDFDFVIPVLAYAGDLELYDLIARRLEAAGRRVALIALFAEGERRLRVHHPHVFYLYNQYREDYAVAPSELARIEARYGVTSMADHVYAERRYFGGTVEKLVARGAYTFLWLERFLEEHRVGAFVNNVGGETVRRTMARIASSGGPPNIIIDFVPLHGRFVVTTDEFGWDELPLVAPPLTDAERRLTEELVAEATRARKMFSAPNALGMNLGSLVRPLRQFASKLLLREHTDWDPFFVYDRRLRHLARRAWMLQRNYFEQPVMGERYLFFPMHEPIDSAITVRSPQFQNQDEVISFIAERGLPTGMTLYVKPHPAARDAYAITMLERLRAMPGVRLLEPSLNSHGLIAGAEAVVVINSTVGFESLLHMKPVVVMGRVFYRGRGVTHDVEFLGDLPAIIRDAVHTPVDRDAVLRFIHACWKTSTPGIYGRDHSDENIGRLANALMAKADRVGATPGVPRQRPSSTSPN